MFGMFDKSLSTGKSYPQIANQLFPADSGGATVVPVPGSIPLTPYGAAMYVAADGGLVVSPTDLTNYLACRHLTTLDLAAAHGLLAVPERYDEALELLRERGFHHERAYLAELRAAGFSVTEIHADDLLAGEAATVEAMRAGVDVIYQATFFDGSWRGHADFLEKRADRPSELGDWSYDIADTKLARRLKVPALLQMAAYAQRLEQLQGRPPELLTVVAGDGQRRSYRLDDCASYARRVREQLVDTIAARPSTYPEKVRFCAQCRWDPHCSAQRRADDHLSLVAGMRREQARELAAGGVASLAALAVADPAGLPPALPAPVRGRLVQQARLQAVQRATGTPTYELLPPQPRRGLALLPVPSPGDLFLDLEGDPYVGDTGLEYLFGLTDVDDRYVGYWARGPAEEKQAFEQAVDHLMRAWAADPAMHVYHYAAYEPDALSRLSARHETRVDEVDRLLRGGRLVDLYAVVRHAVRVGSESYSIKKLEAFYDPHGRSGAAVADAASSIAAFERWLAGEDERELAAIERYNESDCRSTRLLRDWLEQRRAELVDSGLAVDRPAELDGAPSERAAAALAAGRELRGALLAELPADRGQDSETQRGTRLLADLLDWHRREARPEWWEYFRRLQAGEDELVEDPAAVGRLGPPVLVRTDRRGNVWRLDFPPQDTKARPGDQRWLDPRTERPPGTVAAIDAERGWLELRRADRLGPPSCRALVPAGPIDDASHREALRRLGEWVAEHGIDAPGPFRAARDLLLRRPPRRVGTGPLVAPGESAAGAVPRLAGELSGGVLAVQGPPGAGKTWAAAHAVVELVRAGRRVGLCAFSHRAIANLLDAVMAVAATAGVTVPAMQKADGEDRCTAPAVRHVTGNHDIAAALAAGEVAVVAGTTWLFAREEMAEAVDVLVVDEAGQLSLANVLAIAGAADNVLLFGDPQQLSQPAKGDHPAGAGASALEHVLGGAGTMPPELGVFLDRSWRMHPAICAAVSSICYDGRLTAHESCATQAVTAPGLLTGAGVRWIPVAHLGNRATSGPEVDTVAALYADLIEGGWRDAQGVHHPLGADDVLVVAPYNAHVGRLRARLPAGARVGTVDRFQGQEAAVVIYSMATSTAEDAPRGLDFLFNVNRLNVALSRARALAAVVASPALLDAMVRTPEQLRMVNALCRIAEIGELVRPAPATVPTAG
jgi:predicted RecB family nuclease